MDILKQKLDWRLTVVLLFIVLTIIYSVYLSINNLIGPKQQPVSVQPSPTLVQSQLPIFKTPSPVPSSLQDWKTYKNSYYEIKYPTDWKIEQLKTLDGQASFFKPIQNTQHEPILSVGVNKSNDYNKIIQTRKQFYENLGFKESKTTIDNIEGLKLSGSTPNKIIKGKLALGKTQEINIFVIKSKYDYVIKYTYEGEINQEYDKLFTKILSTLYVLQ